jgi:hypothetical protein
VRRDARVVFEGSGKYLSLRVVTAGVSAWSLVGRSKVLFRPIEGK